jgi:hypothetical protein
MPQPEAVIAHQDKSEGRSNMPVRVFVVDDEPVIASTLALILKMNE